MKGITKEKALVKLYELAEAIATNKDSGDTGLKRPVYIVCEAKLFPVEWDQGCPIGYALPDHIEKDVSLFYLPDNHEYCDQDNMQEYIDKGEHEDKEFQEEQFQRIGVFNSIHFTRERAESFMKDRHYDLENPFLVVEHAQYQLGELWDLLYAIGKN